MITSRELPEIFCTHDGWLICPKRHRTRVFAGDKVGISDWKCPVCGDGRDYIPENVEDGGVTYYEVDGNLVVDIR